MNKEVDELIELVTNLVQPDQRAAVAIIPEHITLLHGKKNKKQHSRKKSTLKSGKLTRRKNAELGLYTLPTRQMRYEEALPLHKLWCGYMREHLGLCEGEHVPQVYDHNYDEFCKILVKTDLHGAKMKVVESKCPTLVGISGIMVLETKNVFKILGEDHRIRTIPKSESIFCVKLGNMDITIFGRPLAIRSAERSVKKIKHLIQPL